MGTGLWLGLSCLGLLIGTDREHEDLADSVWQAGLGFGDSAAVLDEFVGSQLLGRAEEGMELPLLVGGESGVEDLVDEPGTSQINITINEGLVGKSWHRYIFLLRS